MNDKNDIKKETEKTEGPAKKARKVIKGVTHFLKKEKRIINKEQIESILPHRGRMLLLDRVIITAKKITGEFTVTKEVCEGHAVLDGEVLLKGSDFLDMAAQLLGVWTAQGSNFEGRKTVIREYGGAKFRKPTSPGELLVLEIETDNVSADDVYGDGRLIIAKGENFLARVGEERKTEVYSVELVIY